MMNTHAQVTAARAESALAALESFAPYLTTDPDAIHTEGLDPFEIARACYWFAAHYYAGQGDPLYRLVCGAYRPGMNERDPDEDRDDEADGARELYTELGRLHGRRPNFARMEAMRLGALAGLIEPDPEPTDD